VTRAAPPPTHYALGVVRSGRNTRRNYGGSLLESTVMGVGITQKLTVFRSEFGA